MLVDSGGFASLFDSATVRKRKGLGVLEIVGEDGTETLTPQTVLELQENIADVAFTLDFPIPPKMDKLQAHKRFELTLANAQWTLDNRRRKDLPLYACVQAWDADSAREMARAYAQSPFDGIAIGGLVPRARDKDTVLAITEAVKAEIGEKPLHVFGLGKPELVHELFKLGVDSVDSSAYVKLAAKGKTWDGREIAEPTGLERLRVALENLAVAGERKSPLCSNRHASPTIAST